MTEPAAAAAPSSGHRSTGTAALDDLAARLAAVERWRDQFLADLDAAQDNEEALSVDPAAPAGTDDLLDDEGLDPERLVAWVHRHVAAVIARPLRGEVR